MNEIKTEYDLIENLDIGDRTKEVLSSLGYITIGDLIKEKEEKLREIFESRKYDVAFRYYGSTAFRHLKAILHVDYGLTFDNEFEDRGLSREVALTKIEDLGLPTSVRNVLHRQLGVYTFGDLLNIEYDLFIRARNMGTGKLKILKDYVHSLGYTLKNEEPMLEEVLEKLRSDGVELLEEKFPNAKVYMPLYKNGIYTIEDLVNYGPDVLNIVRIGELRQKELLSRMQELGLTFVVSNKKVFGEEIGVRPAITINIPGPAVAIRPADAIIKQAQFENEAIKSRIEYKEQLVKEYGQLMVEREQLLAREKELDELIASKVNGMKEGVAHGRK